MNETETPSDANPETIEDEESFPSTPEEMAPYTAVMKAAKTIATRSLRRPHAGSILIPIELYDDLCEAAGMPRSTE